MGASKRKSGNTRFNKNHWKHDSLNLSEQRFPDEIKKFRTRILKRKGRRVSKSMRKK